MAAPGVLTPQGLRITLAEAKRRNDISKIIERHGTWAVTEYGVECLASYYPIEAKRLGKGLEEGAYYTWERHLRTKVWVNQADLRAALEAGRRIHAGKWEPAGNHA